MKNRRIGFAIRIVVAVFVSIVAWYSCSRAYGSFRTIQSAVCHVTDWPVAVVGRLLFPGGHQAIDVFYGRSICDFCDRGERVWRHVRLSVPVYVLIFYVPNGVWWLIGRFRRKRLTVESPNAT